MRQYRCIKETSTNVLHAVGSVIIFPEGVTPNPDYWVPTGDSAVPAVPVSKADALKAEKEQARMVFEAMGKNADLRLTKVSEIRQALAKALDEARTMLTNAGVELGNEQDVDGLMELWRGVFVEQPADVVKK